MCEWHYNNIVAKPSFINKLKKATNLISSHSEELEKKKVKLSNDKEPFEDFGSHVSFSDPTCEILQKRIDELKSLNSQLLIENEVLKKKLNERFTNQQDHIFSVIEIAKKERSNLYNDILNLMKDQERFSLDSLLEYSSSK